MGITLLTGGSGRLGRELVRLDSSVLAPISTEFNLLDSRQMVDYLRDLDVDTIIHCAAYTNVVESEKNPDMAINTNIIGTINILNICKDKNIRLVYISTDYVFDGKKGDYDVDDCIGPVSNYAKTKAAAELVVRTYKKSLVIRTSFFGRDFPYEKAFVDQYSSKDYVDLQALRVLNAYSATKYGIIHVGTEKRSIYDIAKIRKPAVKRAYLKDSCIGIPKDTSLRIK